MPPAPQTLRQARRGHAAQHLEGTMNAPLPEDVRKALESVTLDDKYALEHGRAFMSGVQALVRLPMLQRQRDALAGLNTAGFISGYRGSPLGSYDQALWQAKKHLAGQNIVVQPGVDAWGWEHRDGVVMNGGAAEHGHELALPRCASLSSSGRHFRGTRHGRSAINDVVCFGQAQALGVAESVFDFDKQQVTGAARFVFNRGDARMLLCSVTHA
jgi:hypothetical protein